MRALALVALLLAHTPKDVLPPGHKAVRHELLLVRDAAPVDWVFFVSPVRGFGGSERIEPGTPFGFSSKYGSRIYAYRKDGPLPSPDGVADLGLAVAAASIPVAEVGSAALWRPLARVVTTLDVKMGEADQFRLEPVAEARYDAFGRELGGASWLPLLLLAGLGAAWILRLQRTVGARAPHAGAS